MKERGSHGKWLFLKLGMVQSSSRLMENKYSPLLSLTDAYFLACTCIQRWIYEIIRSSNCVLIACLKLLVFIEHSWN